MTEEKDGHSMYHGVISQMNNYFPFFSKKGEEKEKDSDLLRFHVETLDMLHSNALIVSYIYNHKTLSYDYFSPNIKEVMGYDNKDFQEGGLKFSMSLVHPEHNKIYNKSILPIMFKYYYLYAFKRKIKDLKFSFTFKIKRNDGEYIWMLHNMSVLELNKWGFPLRTLVQITDITDIKKNDAIDITIHIKEKDQIYKPVYTKVFSADNKFSLSERELEILYLLYEGKSTKEIAGKLNISFHTVTTHRKNMLKKSNLKNTAELMKLIKAR